MFEITIKGTTAAELQSGVAALALLIGGALPDVAVAAAVEEPAAPKPRASRKPAEPKGDEGKADASPSATSTKPDASDAEPSADTTALYAWSDETKPAATYADVQAAVTKLAAKKGRDAVIAVFDQFGVDHGSKLTEAQWPEAIVAMGDALSAEALA